MPTRSPSRVTTSLRLLAAVGLLVGSTGLLVATAGPAQAEQRVIEIDFGGPTPATLTVERGDTIAFRNTDAAFPHTVAARSTNWTFSATINPGEVFEVPGAITTAGTYVYGSNSSLEDYEGEVVLPGAAKPTRKPTARPSSRPSSSPSPAASPTEGGRATTPPLFGEAPPSPSDSPSGGPTPETAPEPEDTASPSAEEEASNALASGDLGQPPTPRAYGLPAAVATVGAAGTASLLVRFLLAQPAGRRRDSGPLVTLDDPA